MNRAEALRWWQAGYQAGHQAAGQDLVDDACAKKAVAELTRD